VSAPEDCVQATCYLQIEPEWYHGAGIPRLTGARVVRMTQRRPTCDGNPTPAPSTVIVALTVRVPRSAYDVPTVTVELPATTGTVGTCAVVTPPTSSTRAPA
jgi:hypothetical protein